MQKFLTFVGGMMIVTGLVVLGTPIVTHGEFDFPGLSEQVQNQQTQLDNHDARITNVEKDVNVLQQDTGSQPASDRVSVPNTNTGTTQATGISTQAIEPTPPAPTIVKREHKMSEPDASGWCTDWETDTYSDGTVKTFIDGGGCGVVIGN